PARRAGPADVGAGLVPARAEATSTAELAAPAPERAAELAQIATEALACTRCKLAPGRRTVVFGSGNPDADLMFIGEGPGAEEDRQGLPFVGPAGQLLTKIIGAIGLGREQVYICNVVKCRPPGNRDPQPDEVAACRGFLEAQVRLVRPRVIVALGRVAAQTLLGNDLPVGRLRGAWHQMLGVPLRVTYHPAALLRDEGLKRPTWEDMRVVRDRLAAAATG
ncbi:MAG TPA: uracil-DNA glycosylase, partial [Thermoanaerobaculia bacterium]|nr:uracil-DNA glycosylase [Thermoanaerobaculia bacterium]